MNGRPKGPTPTRKRPTSFRYGVRSGASCRVLVRGVVRRPEHTTLVRIPKSLHERLAKYVDGPITTAIVALADYALMTLEKNETQLTIDSWTDEHNDGDSFTEENGAD